MTLLKSGIQLIVGTTLACLCVAARRQVVVQISGQGQTLSLQF